MTKRHDCASGSSGFAGTTTRRRAEASAQGCRVDEVREGELAVDLDRGKELPVASLQLGLPADVHHLELEAELGAQLADDLERPRAEAAVSRVVDGDVV